MVNNHGILVINITTAMNFWWTICHRQKIILKPIGNTHHVKMSRISIVIKQFSVRFMGKGIW